MPVRCRVAKQTRGVTGHAQNERKLEHPESHPHKHGERACKLHTDSQGSNPHSLVPPRHNKCQLLSCSRVLIIYYFFIYTKKGKVQTYARDETLEDENSAMEHNCHNKLSILQNELQEDDSSTFPLEWLMENIIKSKRCISMLLLMVYTYIMELSDVLHNSSDVAPWLLCAVITFTLTCMLVKHLKKTMKQHEQPRENDGQGDDDFPNRQHDDWQPDNEGQEDHYHSLDNPINMPAEVLNPEGLDEQNNGAAEQVLAGMADECCNENFEITKMPTAETQPASQYSS
ncbi:uncharacterized protein LOC108935556 isoform X3 [Scleropages formosus]|uniref:uncharacterized protein LOC108935556 isoform X3 n=1 Tax=Scleropages formosus TaxID=113540 RepID=UPI00087836D9|nr:uncharacterized protein LOC108935556 isoform X3 [Scleropages formosus]